MDYWMRNKLALIRDQNIRLIKYEVSCWTRLQLTTNTLIAISNTANYRNLKPTKYTFYAGGYRLQGVTKMNGQKRTTVSWDQIKTNMIYEHNNTLGTANASFLSSNEILIWYQHTAFFFQSIFVTPCTYREKNNLSVVIEHT